MNRNENDKKNNLYKTNIYSEREKIYLYINLYLNEE